MISAVRGMVRGRMLHTVEMISVVFCTPLSGVLHTAQRRKNFVIEYLNKIKTDFENTLACLSEAHICSNHRKKTGGRKSRDTLPLTLHGC